MRLCVLPCLRWSCCGSLVPVALTRMLRVICRRAVCSVQGKLDPTQAATFHTSLQMFVDSGFDRAASVHNGADLAAGTGGLVNNGYWSSTPHGNENRVANFDFIITLLLEVR